MHFFIICNIIFFINYYISQKIIQQYTVQIFFINNYNIILFNAIFSFSALIIRVFFLIQTIKRNYNYHNKQIQIINYSYSIYSHYTDINYIIYLALGIKLLACLVIFNLNFPSFGLLKTYLNLFIIIYILFMLFILMQIT